MKKYILAILVLVALAAGGVAVLSLLGRDNLAKGTSGSAAESTQSRFDYQHNSDILVSHFVAAGAANGVTPADASAASLAAAANLKLLLEGSFDDYVSHLSGLDIKLDSDHVAYLQKWWEPSTRKLRTAGLDTQRAEVFYRVRHGRTAPGPVAAENSGTVTRGAYRPRGNDVEDPVYDRTTVVEVAVPISTTDVEGQGVSGKLGFVVARRPTDGRWIVIGLTMRDIPAGHAVHMPPF